MPQESSATPGRRPLPKTYRLPEDLFLATAALADLFHGGTFTRVGEDALCEQLTELSYLPTEKKAALMPQPETTTTSAAVLAGLEDIRELLEAMQSRMRSSTTSRFILRASTRKQMDAAFATWPKVADFVYPKVEHHDFESNTPVKLFVHPRTVLALNQWTEELKAQVPNASASQCIQMAIRQKAKNVGLDPIEHWRSRAEFTRPVFARLPHPDTTFDTRSFEERAMAITMALKVLGDAVVSHTLDVTELPPSIVATVERFRVTAQTTPFEE